MKICQKIDFYPRNLAIPYQIWWLKKSYKNRPDFFRIFYIKSSNFKEKTINLPKNWKYSNLRNFFSNFPFLETKNQNLRPNPNSKSHFDLQLWLPKPTWKKWKNTSTNLINVNYVSTICILKKMLKFVLGIGVFYEVAVLGLGLGSVFVWIWVGIGLWVGFEFLI